MRFRSLLTFFATLGALVAVSLFGSAATASATESPNPVSSTGTTYVYWSYWNGQADGTWAASNVGAGSDTPADGSVVGWRWSAGASGDINQPPREAASFAAICDSTPPQAGQKRVGVVIDFGTPAVAPDGQTPPANVTKCVVGASTENGLQVTSGAAAERSTPEGQVCGLDGYPATGCGGPVPVASAIAEASAAPSTAPASTESSSTSWVPFVIGLLILLALIAGGVAIAKNRKRE